MTNVATARRNRFMIIVRRVLAHTYYGLHRVLRSIGGVDNKLVETIIAYPRITDVNTLGDIANRIAWYLPKSSMSNVEILIPVAPDLLDTPVHMLPNPDCQERYVTGATNIHLMESHPDDLAKGDAILLWDKRKLFSPFVLRYLHKVFIVDPGYYHSFESFIYPGLYQLTIDHKQREQLARQSRVNFAALLQEVAGCRRGYVFGTGPSLEKAYAFDFDGGFKVICNTIVKNQSLLRHIKPQLLVFQDGAHHLSPSRYSAEFRRMVLETVRVFGCYIMVPTSYSPLLLAHYPGLENRVIGIESLGIRQMSSSQIIKMLLSKPWRFLSMNPAIDRIPRHEERFNFPTPEKMYLRLSTTVLASFMVPVVSFVCDEIYIIGADGRAPGDKYFWSYNNSSQFGDLMQTLFDTHPSFFRDSNYTGYYKMHCKCFEDLLSYGESMGKEYYSLTPSHIPALARRPAPPEKIRKAK